MKINTSGIQSDSDELPTQKTVTSGNNFYAVIIGRTKDSGQKENGKPLKDGQWISTAIPLSNRTPAALLSEAYEKSKLPSTTRTISHPFVIRVVSTNADLAMESGVDSDDKGLRILSQEMNAELQKSDHRFQKFESPRKHTIYPIAQLLIGDYNPTAGEITYRRSNRMHPLYKTDDTEVKKKYPVASFLQSNNPTLVTQTVEPTTNKQYRLTAPNEAGQLPGAEEYNSTTNSWDKVAVTQTAASIEANETDAPPSPRTKSQASRG